MYITTNPVNTTIKILNIKDKFYQGIGLNPGQFLTSTQKQKAKISQIHDINDRKNASCRAGELGVIDDKEIVLDYHCDPSDSRFPLDKSFSKSPDKNGDIVYAHRPQIIWHSIIIPLLTLHIGLALEKGWKSLILCLK